MQDGPLPDLPVLILAPAPESRAGAEALMALAPDAGMVPDIAAALAGLAAAAEARLVLLCPRPEIWLARLLAGGTAPSAAAAVEEWCGLVRDTMAGLRRVRRRTVVIFDETLCRSAPACAAALGLDWAGPPPPPPPGDPLLAVIARDALLRHPEARALAGELEAMAFVPEGQDPFFDPDPEPMLAAYRATLRDLDGSRAEGRLLRDRLAGQDVEIAARTSELHLLRDQIRLEGESRQRLQDDLAQREAAARVEAEAQARALAASRAECDLLRDQIRLDSGALQKLHDRLAEQTDRAARAEAARDGLQAETARERDAAQAKLARTEAEAQEVIRQLRDQLHQMGQGLESHRVQLEALQAEREDLLVQIRELHHIREELEGYFDRAQELAGQVDGLSAEIGRLQAEALARQQALLESTRHAGWLQEEIQRIHRSRSYRLMAPLRRIRSALRTGGRAAE